MDNYFILKIKGWSMGFFKGTIYELSERFESLGIKMTTIVKTNENDLGYNYNIGINTTVKVLGYDAKYFESICKEVEKIIGAPVDYRLREELRIASKKKVTREIESDAIYILSSDGKPRTDGVSWIGRREFLSLSKFTKERIDDALSQFGLRLV